jgi:hypothetical protein
VILALSVPGPGAGAVRVWRRSADPTRCLPAVRSRLALGSGAPHPVGSMGSGTLRPQLGEPASPSEGATAPAPCGSSGMIAGA